jgi:hypothetical protein
MATDDSTLGIAAEWWEELRGEFRTTPAQTPQGRRGRLGVHRRRRRRGGPPDTAWRGDGRGGRFYPAFEGRYRVLEPSLDGVTLGPASTRSAALGTLPG